MVINPWAAGKAADGAALGSAFAAGNPTAFVPNTGVMTDPTFVDGPLVGTNTIY